MAVALAVSAATCLGGLGARPVAAQPAARARQGEAYTFILRFLGSVDAGRARLAVSPPVLGPSGPQINVVGEAEATGLAKQITNLHDEYRLVLDGTTWLPRRMHLTESGLRIRTVDVEIDGRRVDIKAVGAAGEKRWSGILPGPPVEPIAVLLLMRAVRLKDGDRLALVVMDGSVFYQGTIDVVGREEVVSELGRYRAIKLACTGERINENGQKLARPPRTATIWVSDDAARLPLRVEGETELGKAVFSLTSYEPSRRPMSVPKTLAGITEQSAAARQAANRPPPPPAAPPPAAPAPAATPDLHTATPPP